MQHGEDLMATTTRAGSAPRKAAKSYKGEKRGRKPPPHEESARERFLRIGNGRMVNALHTMDLLGNLCRGAYDWTMEDVDKMEATLIEKAKSIADQYRKARGGVKKVLPDFSFTGPPPTFR